MSNPVLELKSVGRRFQQGSKTLEILRGASEAIQPGEIVSLVAPSGAGKSTLLQVAGLLERPDDGDIIIDGQSCGAMDDQARTEVRRNKLGFVYQYHHLLPEFSAVENIVLPQMIAGTFRREALSRGEEILDSLGLGERVHHRPAEMSGGEQQRVAIGRAIANVPKVLLADEPTGNLDPETADRVFNHLVDIARSQGIGVLLATHNHQLAGRTDRSITLTDGRLEPLLFS